MAFHVLGLVEEILRGHSEEFGFVGRSIAIEIRGLTATGALPQLHEFCLADFDPAIHGLPAGEYRRTIRHAIQHVELVRKFVVDNVVPLFGMACVSLRMFNVYGPRSRTSGTYDAVFGVFLAQKLAGEPFTVVGDGSQRRDFLYVTDLARAFLAAAASGRNGAF